MLFFYKKIVEAFSTPTNIIEPFLKENKKAEYIVMFMNKTLNKHLKEIQEIAQVRVDLIVEQLKKENTLTEEMKNTNQLYWVGMMNNFKNEAEEIVYNELIYV